MPGFKKSPKPDQKFKRTRPVTEERWNSFLEELARTANLSHSADATGIGRNTVYDKRKNDPEFEARYQEAYKKGYDTLEEECQRRAFAGYEEPVFYKGEQVATITRFSDSLAQFLLKGNKQEKFRDRVETIDGGSVTPSRFSKMTTEELEEELKRRLR